MPEVLAYRPSATAELVEWAEDELGVKLPSAYKQMVLARNGGDIFLTGIISKSDLPEWYTDRRVYFVDELAGISRDDSLYSITSSTQLATEEWEGPKGLVALAGEGHTWLCLDYRECGPNGNPSIVHSDNGSESPSGECEEYLIADSFDDFLLNLGVDYDGDYLIGSDTVSKSEIEKRLEKRFSMKATKDMGRMLKMKDLDGFRGIGGDEKARIMLGEYDVFQHEDDLLQAKAAAEEAHKNTLISASKDTTVIPVSVHFDDAEKLVKALVEAIGDDCRVLHCPMDGPQID